MRAYDIATAGKPWVDAYSKTDPIVAVQTFMQFVSETSGPVIKGLVGIMAEEIQHRRLDGREYMGGNSTDIGQCTADSEVLLARYLLDHSSHGTPPGYVKPQLQNIAWYIATREGGSDSFHNWLEAERRYIRDALEYLTRLQTELQKPKQPEADAALVLPKMEARDVTFLSELVQRYLESHRAEYKADQNIQ